MAGGTDHGLLERPSLRLAFRTCGWPIAHPTAHRWPIGRREGAGSRAPGADDVQAQAAGTTRHRRAAQTARWALVDRLARRAGAFQGQHDADRARRKTGAQDRPAQAIKINSVTVTE